MPAVSPQPHVHSSCQQHQSIPANISALGFECWTLRTPLASWIVGFQDFVVPQSLPVATACCLSSPCLWQSGLCHLFVLYSTVLFVSAIFAQAGPCLSDCLCCSPAWLGLHYLEEQSQAGKKKTSFHRNPFLGWNVVISRAAWEGVYLMTQKTKQNKTEQNKTAWSAMGGPAWVGHANEALIAPITGLLVGSSPLPQEGE